MTQPTRRQFSNTCLATAALVTLPSFSNASSRQEQQLDFEFDHDWAKLPDQFKWQTTHNVAVDSNNRVYVIHEGRENLKEHPSIFVFDENGNYVRSFGSQFQGGGHGIEVRKEGSEEFLYVCAYQQVKSFAKLTLNGETVWQKFAPMKSDVYAKGEASEPKKVWGRDRFMPTNFAFLPDGDFFLADGYGSWYIHRYDKDGNWKSKFGGPGQGSGKFDTPHGIWIDDRAAEARIVVADRAHHTLQILSIAGEHLETISGFGLPANIDIQGKLMLVPELLGRVSILDENNKVIAQIGDDSHRVKADKNFTIRRDATKWQDAKFIHPHDACFDNDGNIYVPEWVATGRITRLTKKN